MMEHADQLTLGDLIEALRKLDGDCPVEGFTEPHSYRGYYSDLAFQGGGSAPASEVLEIIAALVGVVFTGYKGGDFQMDEDTPVWSASHGSSGRPIVGIRVNEEGASPIAPERPQEWF